MIETNKIMQQSYVVADLQAAMAHCQRALRAGPFFWFERIPVTDVRYRGRPAAVAASLALSYAHGTWLEMIAPLDHAPSVFEETITAHGYGFHHSAIATLDYDADLASHVAHGMPVVSDGRVVVGARAAFLDTGLGTFLELIELTPPVEELFGMIREAAQGWDGSAPIRQLG